MNKEQIIYTNWGVANVFKDGTIEIHKDLNLPKYKSLKLKILDHERDHDFEKGFWHNFKVDFFHYVKANGLFQFMIKRPKTWIQFLPFYYTKSRGFIYDKNLIFFYSLKLLAVIVLIKFIGG